MSLGTDYLIRYLSDISGAVKGAKQVEAINATMAKNIQAEYGQATRIIGNLPTTVKTIPIKVDGQEAIKTITTTGQVLDTTSGKFLELSKVTTRIGNDFKTTSVSAKNVTDQFKLGNLEAEKGGKVFSNFMNTVKQLGGRALLTIPIWIALRGAIMGVFSGIQGGIQNLISFDLALQKIRNNMQGTPAEVDSAFKKIRTSITEASKATGISTEELANAVKQFATLGFSANESLQGALGASKLSIALFGDAGETAGAFARALNIMIDRSVGAKSAIDQMNEAFALTSQLEETNNFEIKNVTEALDKFAGTAAGVGLTMNQTLAILAALGTAGRRGSEGATLLSTSFNQLLTNIPKISKSLGLVVGAGESTFSIFTRILDKVTELNNTPGGKSSSIQAIADIFGGARGIKIVQSLVAVKGILDANIATLPSFTALSQKADRTMNSESGQAKILGNNLKEMAKSFITAIAGSEDFTAAIVKLNNVVKGISEGLKPLGTTIKVIFDNLGFIAGAAFLLNFRKIITIQAIAGTLLASQAAVEGAGLFLSYAFSRGFLTGFKFIGKYAIASIVAGFVGIGAAGVGGVLAAVVAAIFSPITIIAGIVGKLTADALTENFIRGVEAKNAQAQAVFGKVIDGLRGQLSIADLTVLIEKLTLEQKPGDQAMIRQIGALRSRLQKQVDQSKIIIEPKIEIQPLISFEEQQSISKLLLANKIEELKLQGATNVQLAQAKILGTDQLKIKEDTITLLGNQLDLEKAIQEEKRLQNKLGSDSIKLFEISQTEGVAAAKAIGDVLSGETGFSDFARRGGKNLEIFKKEFADLFKQQQALQFFTGERVSGEPTLRGGSNIAIQEEALRGQRPIGRTELTRAQTAAEAQFTKITQVQTTVPVTVTANIDVSKLSEVKKHFVMEITKQLPQVGSDVNNALVQALTGKQGNTL
jgi:TP901 family phage tail tape measure protein